MLAFDSCGNPTERTKQFVKEIFQIQRDKSDRLVSNESDDQFHHLRARQVICSMILGDLATRLVLLKNKCKARNINFLRPGSMAEPAFDGNERRWLDLTLTGPSLAILKTLDNNAFPLPHVSHCADVNDTSLPESTGPMFLTLSQSMTVHLSNNTICDPRLDVEEKVAITDLYQLTNRGVDGKRIGGASTEDRGRKMWKP